MEKRKSMRYDASQEMKGKLLNVVSFVANNISSEGINLVSSFQPVIGSRYKIFLAHKRNGGEQDFEIEINRAEVAPFDATKHAALSPGLLISIGATFKNMSAKQQEFLTSFIQKKVNSPKEGYISRDDVKPGS